MKQKKYTETDIDAIVVELSEEFEIACQIYRLTLSSRDSNRSKKELIKENRRGTVIHRYQCDFAWIIYDIKCGPICEIENNMSAAHELILALKKISNT